MRLVAELLVTADPELALVPADHVAAAAVNSNALDRLVGERFALGGPVLEGAGLEIEVERLAVGTDGQHPFARLRRLRVGGGNEKAHGAQQSDERDKTAHGTSAFAKSRH